jgi:DNA-binding winged helix-turn-helix (wHTH) protein
MAVSFGEFTFRADTRQLVRRGAEVHLSPKAFDLLGMLLDARPAARSKMQLMEQLWPGTFVSEAGLSVLVAEIRAALGDSPRTPRFIRTIQRYGYAFCGEASAAGPANETSTLAAAAPVAWLMTGTTRTPLTHGASVIGRDPRAEVPLNLPGISRRHARIDVNINLNGAQATVTDLESKNGTYVRGERIGATVHVLDGDEIRIGPIAFTVRLVGPQRTTETESLGEFRLPDRR